MTLWEHYSQDPVQTLSYSRGLSVLEKLMCVFGSVETSVCRPDLSVWEEGYESLQWTITVVKKKSLRLNISAKVSKLTCSTFSTELTNFARFSLGRSRPLLRASETNRAKGGGMFFLFFFLKISFLFFKKHLNWLTVHSRQYHLNSFSCTLSQGFSLNIECDSSLLLFGPLFHMLLGFHRVSLTFTGPTSLLISVSVKLCKKTWFSSEVFVNPSSGVCSKLCTNSLVHWNVPFDFSSINPWLTTECWVLEERWEVRYIYV